MKAILGNTYAIKDEIKAAGGKWNGDFWIVDDSVYDALQAKAGVVEILFEYSSGFGHFTVMRCDGAYMKKHVLSNGNTRWLKTNACDAYECAPRELTKEQMKAMFPKF